MLALPYRFGSNLYQERWLIIMLLFFCAVIQWQYITKIQHSEHGTRSAFLRWRVQLQDLDDGLNVWDKYAYPNPPIMAVILRPFLQLSPITGAMLWFACKACMAILSILAMLTLLNDPERPFPVWGKLIACALALRPIEGDLIHGNVNLLILFLLVTSLYAFCQRWECLAGILLGLSIACKVTPVLFIVYFLWKRAWRTLLGTLIGMLLFILVVPGVVFGWNENLGYLRSWYHQMVTPYAAGIVTSEHKNQSLPGLLSRMLTDEASFSRYEGEEKIVLDTHNMASWNRTAVQGIVIGALALFALSVMWKCRTSTERRPRWQLMAEFSIIILGMLLFCERTWKHHCVTLLFPFSVAAYGLSSSSFSRGMRCALGMTLAMVAVLMLSTTTGHVDAELAAQSRFGKWAQVYGAYVWVFLLLLAAMLVMLSHERTREISS